MSSPFPGMDPYLERHWPDVQCKLVIYGADELNQVLPGDMAASVDERPAVEVQGEDEPITERYIRVIEARSERLVSVIEFLSPANKIGAGLAAFRAKRGELLASGVNFVEIDLVRRGDWRKLLRPHCCPASAVAAYRFTLRMAADPGAVHFEPISLREPLPAMPVPLRPGDPEVRLELQPLVARAYANGRYDRRLDYRQPCVPPLDGEDAAWAEGLLRGAGRR